MKKIIIAWLMIVSVNGYAQMKTLFFDQPVAAEMSIVDSVLHVLPNYNKDTVETVKSGKAKSIVLLSGNNKKLTISFSFYAEKIYLVTIAGEFEDLYSLYIHYLNKHAAKDELLKKYCADVILEKLPDNRVLPISFCADKHRWVIYTSIPK